MATAYLTNAAHTAPQSTAQDETEKKAPSHLINRVLLRAQMMLRRTPDQHEMFARTSGPYSAEKLRDMSLILAEYHDKFTSSAFSRMTKEQFRSEAERIRTVLGDA